MGCAVSALGNAEVSRLSTLRLDGVQERKSAAGAQDRVAAAESFGALLQMASGSGGANGLAGVDAASSAAALPVDRPVSAGMASLIAQGGYDTLTGGQNDDAQAAPATGSDTVTIAPNADFRWMATLIANQGE